ncbi:MAG: membrane protease YdiL (CAAX protease family) [Arenicella sp.]|jgi:membrane protease YdiL (CAAX protease family)
MNPESAKKTNFTSSIIYCLVSFILIGSYQFSTLFSDNYWTFLALSAIWWSFTLAFALFERENLLSILTSKVRLRQLAIILFVSIWSAIGIRYLAIFLSFFYLDLKEVTYIFWQSDYPILFSVLFLSFFPAIFEELAFRGIILGSLLKSTTPKMAIFISSLLFALIHFNVIALIWLIPLGMLFGYFRYKYGSIWYCILGHFAYNLVIISFEIW